MYASVMTAAAAGRALRHWRSHLARVLCERGAADEAAESHCRQALVCGVRRLQAAVIRRRGERAAAGLADGFRTAWSLRSVLKALRSVARDTTAMLGQAHGEAARGRRALR